METSPAHGLDAALRERSATPYWSQRLGTLTFSLLYRDHYLTLSIADHTVLVRSSPGNLAPIQVGCHWQVRELGNGQSLEFTL